MYRILEHTELEMESNYFESVGFGNGQIDSQKSNLGWIEPIFQISRIYIKTWCVYRGQKKMNG